MGFLKRNKSCFKVALLMLVLTILSSFIPSYEVRDFTFDWFLGLTIGFGIAIPIINEVLK